MSKFFELFTNNDGRASTTGFIQFFGFLVMAGVLIYAVYLDRSTVTDLFFYFACFCGGSAATKGAVMAYSSARNKPPENEPRQNDNLDDEEPPRAGI
ncbi:DUF2644 domain-containing protein [uncultured Haemophilus sp.]|uniref:DUF2644 domain-containing protein n=1 Tax=uncultured Haemophilus sp. TaxID=237779 RepID=UPI0020664F20|nr:DUF2644 domain-containing protein [uncultured Haemophilus sp.]DAR93724.1 MAG TPA: Protein of unknown function (DUF2644) [Caudoviricetes sp.]